MLGEQSDHGIVNSLEQNKRLSTQSLRAQASCAGWSGMSLYSPAVRNLLASSALFHVEPTRPRKRAPQSTNSTMSTACMLSRTTSRSKSRRREGYFLSKIDRHEPVMLIQMARPASSFRLTGGEERSEHNIWTKSRSAGECDWRM
eukprot:765441-Hanusia_phi.AAC.4